MSNLFGHKKIPSSPGVYFFRGPNNKALYIGKASNLKNRLASYRKLIHLQGLTLQGLKLRTIKPIRAITPGQSVVFYRGQEMLGGGIIT